MKKVFMAMATAAVLFAASSCACNNCCKKAEAAEESACTECCDSCKACCDSTACAACDSTVVAE
ncbi:MAG: hypothetical protein SPD85_04245 [Candidatus Cryptobacteroides sp.]|nr:hypothetical protein [Candidatus Cryptobacteroides sp.]